MALTKLDLRQIGDVVDEKINKRLLPIENGIKDLKKNLRYVRKTVEVLIGRSDKEETLLKRRVSKIERHLGLPPEN